MKKIISILIVVIVIFIVGMITIDTSNLSNSKTINYNGNKLLVSIDGNSSDKLPTEGKYYLTKYRCGSKNTIVNWDNDTYQLEVSNGSKEGSVLCNITFESKPKLSLMKEGSYVKYVGNNGCSGNSCLGDNANYVSDKNMGYCSTEDNKYITNGWRLMYTDKDTAYIVSAGALECVKRSASDLNVMLYINSMNTRALKYCNANYVNGGVCDNSSVRSINEDDFKKITNKKIEDCYNKKSDTSCGYNNDLIDNGGYYWYSTIYDSTFNNIFAWDAGSRDVSVNSFDSNYGLRPVIRLDSSVYVVSGTGTYKDPYVIAK